MGAASTTPSFLNLATLLATDEAYLDEAFWQKACDLRVSIPAVVVSFDSTKQVVTVQPAIKENFLKALVPVPTALPQLQCPVTVYRGGGFSITLPIQAGEECLVVFADMCIDTWWVSGGTGNNQAERRRHDLSDGIAIFGLCSQAGRKIGTYSTSTLQMRSDDGHTLVEVGANEVTITPDNGTTQVKATTGQVTVTPDGGTSQIKITAGEIDLTATTVKINGVNFHAHVHSGVTTGAGVTGPVTP